METLGGLNDILSRKDSELKIEQAKKAELRSELDLEQKKLEDQEIKKTKAKNLLTLQKKETQRMLNMGSGSSFMSSAESGSSLIAATLKGESNSNLLNPGKIPILG